MPDINRLYPETHEQAADSLAEHVLTRAAAGGFAISGDVRREALALMRQLVGVETNPHTVLHEFLSGFSAILRRYSPLLVRVYTDADLAAFLEGGVGVLRQLPELETTPDWLQRFGDRLRGIGLEQPPEPPEWFRMDRPGEPEPIITYPIIQRAAADLAARDLLSPTDFYWEMERFSAAGFHSSRLAALDVLEKVRDTLVEAIVDGHSIRTWRGRVRDAIDVSQLSERHLERVFRTNVMASYSRGQKAVVENPLVRGVALFAWRVPIEDSRISHLCHALSKGGFQGKGIFLTDSETWRKVAPISHPNCRCSTIFMTLERAAQKGIAIAQKWLKDGVRPSDDELYCPMPDLSAVPLGERNAFAVWRGPWGA